MKTKLIFLFICTCLLTGCWNYNELNELAIVKAVSVDKKGEEYIVNYMISNAVTEKGGGQNSKPQSAILEGTGATISEAVTKINLTSPKKTYIGHMLAYIISEDIAKEGIKEVSDYFFRNNNSKKFFNLIISKDCKAKDVLAILSPLDSFPSDNIVENLATSEAIEAYVSDITFPYFIRTIMSEGMEATTNGIIVIGSSKKGAEEKSLETSTIDNYIKVDTLGLFRGSKLITWADQDVSKGINLLLNTVTHFEVPADCDGKKVIFLINNIKEKIDVNLKNNIVFNIEINSDSKIEEMTCNVNVSDEKELKKLENILKNEILKLLEKTLDFVKKNKTDVFGLGNHIYLNHYKEWQKYKDNWNELYFPDIIVNFKVKTNLLVQENTNEGVQKLKDE